MKRLMVAALVAVMGIGTAVGGTAFASTNHQDAGEIILGEDESTWGPYADEFVPEGEEMIVGEDPSTWSPFTECDVLSDAVHIAGFDMTAPSEIPRFGNAEYAAMENDLIQIQYCPDEVHALCIRKGAGEEDISGDYNVYTEEREIEVSGRLVTIKGNDGKVSFASWTEDGHFFSIGTYSTDYEENYGITESEMSGIIAKIR